VRVKIKKSKSSVWVIAGIISGVLTAAGAIYVALMFPEISGQIAGFVAALIGMFLVLWFFVTGVISIWKITEKMWRWLVFFIAVLLISVTVVLFSDPIAQSIKLGIYTPSPTSMSTPAFKPQPSPIPGVLYAEDFSDTQSGWLQSSNAGEEYQYSDGQYEISVPADGLFHLACANRNLADAVFTVDSMFISGDLDNTWCWVVWYFTDINNFYVLEFNQDGDFCASKRVNGEFHALTVHKLDSINGKLTKGHQWNKIAISSSKGGASISINGRFVASIIDSEFSSGDVCLGAASIGTIKGKVAYDNLVIYSFGAWTPSR
jgi:hypothetical protein